MTPETNALTDRDTHGSIRCPDASRHAFVCGATGSGKTNLLLALCGERIAAGEGLLFIDGKGDAEALGKLSALAREHGREKDVMVLNFAEAPAAGQPLVTNTINPFATCSARGMAGLLVGCMDETDSDGRFWKGRAVAMIGALSRALVSLRDHSLLQLNAGSIRDHLDLKWVINLADRDAFPQIPEQARNGIRGYLSSLPGYQEEKKYKQSQTVLDQHGYLFMQMTRALGAFAEDYGHVFDKGDGEVHIEDVHANGRILVVLLPTASRPRIENLFTGQMVLALLRDLMAHKLAAREGSDQGGVRPFHVVLDEFTQFVTSEIEPMVAQARSLGITFTFATQDMIPASTDREGHTFSTVLANTGTKYLMRSEASEIQRLGPLFVNPGAAEADVRLMRMLEARASMLASIGRTEALAEVEREYGDIFGRAREAEEAAARAPRVEELPALAPGRGVMLNAGRAVRIRVRDHSDLRPVSLPLNSGTLPQAIVVRRREAEAAMAAATAQEAERAEARLAASREDGIPLDLDFDVEGTVPDALASLSAGDDRLAVDMVRRAVRACVGSAPA